MRAITNLVEIEIGVNSLNNTASNDAGSLIVVGIPAYNEEKTIAQVIIGAQKYSHIVIVCDDGSTDLTAEIAERLGAIVVRHERNRGYGAAIQSLFRRAKELRADILITLDSDGQHNPSEIPRLVKPIEEGVADVVLGSRFKDSHGSANMPRYRRFGIKVITTMVNGSGKNGISDAQSGFRAYNRIALERLLVAENGMSASLELLRAINKNGLRVTEVPISCKYGKDIGETSTQNPLRHGMDLILALTRFVIEDRPLVFLGLPGIFSLIIGLLFGAWLLNIYAIEGHIVTNIVLASIAFLLIGCFMVSSAITLYAISRVSKRITGS